MRKLDASGIHRRSPGKKKIVRRNYISRGPNDTWHIDGTNLIFLTVEIPLWDGNTSNTHGKGIFISPI